ncbi:SGNH/GDSL hydrolase family protein [Pseudorhodoferax sp.]|uniref:SGNH/GDSL hydrolase family protein n=1 Tax=Pseudorhodoferax sp. TaxID=1993553 RepID=UPI002DD6229F|nr:SGNH/GDSL hydrolase family protein [Pseudorhodoferax sp.]
MFELPRAGRWQRGLLIAATALCTTFAAYAAPTISRLVVFGDSLSDTGNTRANVPGGNLAPIANAVGYGSNGRFSNGVLWHETMATQLGLPAATASEVSGANNWNYAYGGARVDNEDGPSTGVLRQYADYSSRIGSTGADPSALYVMWAGGNDARDLVGNSSPQAGIDISIGGLQTVLSGLISQGASTFLIPNLPNLGMIPENRGSARAGSATEVSSMWNASLFDMLMGFADQASIYFLDVYSIFDDVLLNPGDYGFTNTTGQCRSTSFGGLVENSCANAHQWTFWDAIHPTTAAHAVIGRAAADLLLNGSPLRLAVPEPSVLVLVLLGLGLMSGRLRRLVPAMRTRALPLAST